MARGPMFRTRREQTFMSRRVGGGFCIDRRKRGRFELEFGGLDTRQFVGNSRPRDDTTAVTLSF
jgi:hypothetical protein